MLAWGSSEADGARRFPAVPRDAQGGSALGFPESVPGALESQVRCADAGARIGVVRKAFDAITMPAAERW